LTDQSLQQQNLHHYRAKTLHEAFQIVRRELGIDATVLETRQVWDGLWRGLLGQRKFEVIATTPRDQNQESHIQAKRSSENPNIQRTLREGSPLGVGDGGVDTATDDLRNRLRENLLRFGDGSRELTAWNNLGEVAAHPRPISDAELAAFSLLLELGYPEPLARDIVQGAAKKCDPRREVQKDELCVAIEAELVSRLMLQGPSKVKGIGPTVIALVGPTGVGKTTTVAKLAADYRLQESLRVGVITIDTFRMAAVEQLRAYAEIMDVPMEVVSSPKEMRQARQRLATCDVVLVDTAGCNPHADVDTCDLAAIITEAKAHEVHLVLSATMSFGSTARTLDKFQKIGTTAIILSKADEAVGLGPFVAAMQGRSIPLSYVTHGQSVPDDITPANVGLMKKLLLQSSWGAA
jgi:flagellar biosynthesis protein FlhF